MNANDPIYALAFVALAVGAVAVALVIGTIPKRAKAAERPPKSVPRDDTDDGIDLVPVAVAGIGLPPPPPGGT